MKTPDPKPFPPRVWQYVMSDGRRIYTDLEQNFIGSIAVNEMISVKESTALLAAVVEERDRLAEALRKIGYMDTGERVVGTSRNGAIKNYGEAISIAQKAIGPKSRVALLRDGEKSDD